jgi:hypothetical protein
VSFLAAAEAGHRREDMQVFDGFPYLVTRIVPALHHLTVLPTALGVPTLLELAKAQIAANNLETCVALDGGCAVYFGVDGSVSPPKEPPRGGAVIAGRLALPIAIPTSVDLRARERRLAEFIENNRGPGGHILGDLTKGGRAATSRELQAVDGVNDDGSPRGLAQCETCADWRGVCLDPSEQFRGKIMTVHCHCANHNRCARCGANLYERRLNANYYERADGQIWHVPGFCGLSHECGDIATKGSASRRYTAPVRRHRRRSPRGRDLPCPASTLCWI